MEEGDDKPEFKRQYGSGEPWPSEVYRNHKEIKWKKKSNTPSLAKIILYAGVAISAASFLTYYGCSIKEAFFSDISHVPASLEKTILS